MTRKIGRTISPAPGPRLSGMTRWSIQSCQLSSGPAEMAVAVSSRELRNDLGDRSPVRKA